MIHAVVFLAGMLAGVGLLVGIVLGLVVAIWAQDAASALHIIRNGYYLLVGLLPIVLWLGLLATRDNEEYDAAYCTPLRAILTTLQGAIVGTILGAGPIFLALVINLPVFLADFAIGDFGSSVRDEIVWSLLLLAVGAAVASAIPLGFWVYYTRSGVKDD
jgi:hypothetical protein